ncbi:MAG TPA: hypothetical protein VEC99_10480, partial [Clostridia bacterium]|nr:hypothetical protein [Clostridia bacterium]
ANPSGLKARNVIAQAVASSTSGGLGRPSSTIFQALKWAQQTPIASRPTPMLLLDSFSLLCFDLKQP